METYEYVIYIDTNNLNLKCQFFRFQDAKDGVVNVYEVDKIHDCLGKNATYIFDVKKEAEPKTWYILEASNGDGLESFMYDEYGEPISVKFQDKELFWDKSEDQNPPELIVRNVTPDIKSDLLKKKELYSGQLYHKAQKLRQDVGDYFYEQIQKDPNWLNKIKQRQCPGIMIGNGTQKSGR